MPQRAPFSFALRYLSPSRPRPALRLVVVLSRFPSRLSSKRSVRRSVLRSSVISSVGSSHPSSLAALCAVSSCSSLVVSPLVPFPVSFIVPPAAVSFVISFRRHLIRRLSAACAVLFARRSSLVVSFRPSSRPVVSSIVHRLVPAPRFLDTMGGAFSFLIRWRADKQARERTDERTDGGRVMDWGRAERARGIAIRHSCDCHHCRDKQAGGRIRGRPASPTRRGGACGRIVFFHARGRGAFHSPSPPVVLAIVPRST